MNDVIGSKSAQSEIQRYERYDLTVQDRVKGLLTILRESQRHGVMMVPTASERDEDRAVRLAALLLLQQVQQDYLPVTGLAVDWLPANGTKLRNDAESLAQLFEAQKHRVAEFWAAGRAFI